jgi:ATP-dependent RNA helicase DDX31/DBP7
MFKMHGNLPQGERTETFWNFSRARSGILFCTDVGTCGLNAPFRSALRPSPHRCAAARGLDLPEVSFIVQYNPPEEAQEYVHRVGRTGRMGQAGTAMLFLLPSELEFIDVLQQSQVGALARGAFGRASCLVQHTVSPRCVWVCDKNA